MKHLQLPTEIKTVEQAKAFLDILIKEDLVYHPEDNAIECIGHLTNQAEHINKLMGDVYDLNENTRIPETFDPCEYILDKDI